MNPLEAGAVRHACLGCADAIEVRCPAAPHERFRTPGRAHLGAGHFGPGSAARQQRQIPRRDHTVACGQWGRPPWDNHVADRDSALVSGDPRLRSHGSAIASTEVVSSWARNRFCMAWSAYPAGSATQVGHQWPAVKIKRGLPAKVWPSAHFHSSGVATAPGVGAVVTSSPPLKAATSASTSASHDLSGRVSS